MRRFRRSFVLASILAAAPLTLIVPTPAAAQFSASIGFDSFHRELANYGDWFYSDRWGEVWRPGAQDRDPDWRPYWAGHWVDTDEYGWTWISDEGDWGDITYHYGRWVYDPDDGWLWLPGYVWSPAWVVLIGHPGTVTDPPVSRAAARNGAAPERSGSISQARPRSLPDVSSANTTF